MLIILGILFMLLMLFSIVTIMAGGSLLALGILTDLPAALFILIPLTFFLIVTKSGKVIRRYIKSSFIKEYTYTKIELNSITTAIKNIIKFLLASGGFCFFIGIMAAFAFFFEKQLLGPIIVSSILSLFYAIAFGFFVFFPTQAWAENKINALSENG